MSKSDESEKNLNQKGNYEAIPLFTVWVGKTVLRY